MKRLLTSSVSFFTGTRFETPHKPVAPGGGHAGECNTAGAISGVRGPGGSAVKWLLLALLAAGLAQNIRQGIYPAWQNPGGDFANYYTGSRLVAEGAPLAEAYRDFTWFQRQIDRHGIENQLGGFIPHPPSTALVMLPLTALDPLTAKRVWTLFNLSLAAAAIWLLSRVFGLDFLWSAAILVASWSALVNNIRFGQLYLLILVSILCGLWFRQRGRPLTAGFCLGLLVPVKYVGSAWLAEAAWRSRWRAVVGGLFAIGGVLVLTIWLAGWAPFSIFGFEVLPRHLAGEVQDPFSLRLQSWNSLFRRLFLAEPTFNPTPWIEAPGLFFLLRALVFWGIGAVSLLLVCFSRLATRQTTRHFRWGWIALAVLLLSPGSATYHFLLLTLSAGGFVSILLRRSRVAPALCVLLFFLTVNLPHHLWLEGRSAGLLTPLAYSRLWMLVVFALAALYWIRPRIVWPANAWAGLAAFGIVVFLTAGWQWSRHQPNDVDGARPLVVSGVEFGRQLGLILDHPDIGGDRLVFTYCEVFEERYGIWATDGLRWTPPMARNFYNPSLASDGSRLLVETVHDGRTEIWMSPARGQPPVPLAVGEHPVWSPAGDRFVFVREGKLHQQPGEPAGSQVLPTSGPASRPAFPKKGGRLAYLIAEAAGHSLRVLRLADGMETTLLSWPGPIHSLCWSDDGSSILFSATRNGNRDLWSLAVGDRTLVRLTSHPGADDNPVWDAKNGRVIFTSDRGRGLEFSALYWIPMAESLR